MPSGMTLESLNFPLEASYLILFLLPLGVSIMTSISMGAFAGRFRATFPGLRFTAKSHPSARRTQATQAATQAMSAEVANQTDSLGPCAR